MMVVAHGNIFSAAGALSNQSPNGIIRPQRFCLRHLFQLEIFALGFHHKVVVFADAKLSADINRQRYLTFLGDLDNRHSQTSGKEFLLKVYLPSGGVKAKVRWFFPSTFDLSVVACCDSVLPRILIIGEKVGNMYKMQPIDKIDNLYISEGGG
jgi:hypothetical protein